MVNVPEQISAEALRSVRGGECSKDDRNALDRRFLEVNAALAGKTVEQYQKASPREQFLGGLALQMSSPEEYRNLVAKKDQISRDGHAKGCW